ncbi:hypothetical protein EON65_14380 [archaeon]|nr:MAG: hypothetical protein EON65_14380 [archaeon]
MGDSWEDEDFEVPAIANALSSLKAKNDDDEEDETLKQSETVFSPITKSAGVLKREAEEAELRAAKMQESLHANETGEQKRIRERKQAEEADTKLAGDLFAGTKATTEAAQPVSAAKSIASVPLKTKEDHTKLGALLSKRLATSSAFNVSSFYKALIPTLDQPTITTEILDEIMRDIKVIRDSRAVAEKAIKAAATKKSKKQLEAEARAHADKFGDSDRVDQYDHYSNVEDDFM